MVAGAPLTSRPLRLAAPPSLRPSEVLCPALPPLPLSSLCAGRGPQAVGLGRPTATREVGVSADAPTVRTPLPLLVRPVEDAGPRAEARPPHVATAHTCPRPPRRLVQTAEGAGDG